MKQDTILVLCPTVSLTISLYDQSLSSVRGEFFAEINPEFLQLERAQTSCTTNGWFGPDCQYQCHCARSAPCDKHDGSCSSGCHQDWFGPACQYARMGFTVNGHFNSRWLTDNKDTTCNRDHLWSVTVTLDTPIPLIWLRVVVMDAAHLITVNISYWNESSNSTECPESNTAEINRITADVSCPTGYPVTSVTPLVGVFSSSVLCTSAQVRIYT
ncbi:hypothetical protein RRG08_056565 [Elysia crispata]|uniref:Uncharacterized protein n=1 Tax=Elysia crispata TaxID=231223 RepID=A0AAE1DKA1_9GAST|nr:hypothetical protein RRG08_056565 [Elysia crispata]